MPQRSGPDTEMSFYASSMRDGTARELRGPGSFRFEWLGSRDQDSVPDASFGIQAAAVIDNGLHDVAE